METISDITEAYFICDRKYYSRTRQKAVVAVVNKPKINGEQTRNRFSAETLYYRVQKN